MQKTDSVLRILQKCLKYTNPKMHSLKKSVGKNNKWNQTIEINVFNNFKSRTTPTDFKTISTH